MLKDTSRYKKKSVHGHARTLHVYAHTLGMNQPEEEVGGEAEERGRGQGGGSSCWKQAFVPHLTKGPALRLKVKRGHFRAAVNFPAFLSLPTFLREHRPGV